MKLNNLTNNVYFKFNQVQEKIESLETRIRDLEAQLEHSLRLIRTHMVRIKNNEVLSDSYIFNGMGYQDLSPEKAYKLYQKKDYDFILLDVSKKDFVSSHHFPEAKKIPLEELVIRHTEIVNKMVPIFIISEDGTRSIQACHLLNHFGHYNVNNISGGYLYWPANAKNSIPDIDFAESA